MEPDEKSQPIGGMYDGYDASAPGMVPPPHGPPPPYGGHTPSHQHAAPPPAPTNNVFQISNNAGGPGLAPGMCTVCRIGFMKDSATGCTWFMCCLCCFLGLFPGCIAFCCCFRKPKCTHCGYTVG